MNKIPSITVHGRFQPPLHANHWEYIRQGFDRAERVDVLITNPHLNEAFEESASWRNDPENNPFTYDERVSMFRDFFERMKIAENRYSFRPFDIKNEASFLELDAKVPNLVNVYSEWSSKKVDLFGSHGLSVVEMSQPKHRPVSGTIVRQIISDAADQSQLSKKLIDVGFVPEAIPGLLKVLSSRQK